MDFLCPGENDLSQNEDTDMRLPINGLESSSNPKFNDILARAAEQVKNGTMTPKDFEEVQFQVILLPNNYFCVPLLCNTKSQRILQSNFCMTIVTISKYFVLGIPNV